MIIKPQLIVGLGNPGREYEKTYHNVGFLAIDFLSAKNNKKLSKFIQDNIALTRASLLKTNTYMNQSGIFIKKLLKEKKIEPENLLIIHDDYDIELGKYKISFNRGPAGHKGIQSIIQNLNGKNFWRLRIGIKPKTKNQAPLPRIKAENLVLKKINKENLRTLEKIFTE